MATLARSEPLGVGAAQVVVSGRIDPAPRVRIDGGNSVPMRPRVLAPTLNQCPSVRSADPRRQFLAAGRGPVSGRVMKRARISIGGPEPAQSHRAADRGPPAELTMFTQSY